MIKEIFMNHQEFRAFRTLSWYQWNFDYAHYIKGDYGDFYRVHFKFPVDGTMLFSLGYYTKGAVK